MAEGEHPSGSFDLNGLWSPWYTLHKTYAGLRDAYRYTGNRDGAGQSRSSSPAGLKEFCSKLDEAQTQKMLNTEFGGMNEVLADLYADTGDKRWLDLSHHFDHRAVIDPLARHEDILAGLHGNTQVPKLLGSLARLHLQRATIGDGDAAEFFWDASLNITASRPAVTARTNTSGPPDKLSNIVDGRTDRELQRLQHAQDDAHAVRDSSRHQVCRVSRARACSIMFSARWIPKTAAPVTWCRWARACGTNTRTCSRASPAASVRHGEPCAAWRRHVLRSRDRLWVNLYVPSTAEWKARAFKLRWKLISGRRLGDDEVDRRQTQTIDAFISASIVGRPGFAIKVNGKALVMFSSRAVTSKSREPGKVVMSFRWSCQRCCTRKLRRIIPTA